MKAQSSIWLYGLVLLLGLLIGFAMESPWKRIEHTADLDSTISTMVSEEVQPVQSIPELVANQLKSGDMSCPAPDLITYEACLLFQGALGTWQRSGLRDSCPPLIGSGTHSPSADFINASLLRPEDALRATSAPCFSYLYAIQVANATPVLVSTANKMFLMASGKPFSEPASDPNLCLQARYGICGNHAAVGLALFAKAGLKARPIEFYYTSKKQRLSHIIPEVQINAKWYPVDTTYGAYWMKRSPDKPFTLSTLDEILEPNSKTTLIYNNALLPYSLYSATRHTDYFNYLNSNADIIRGGQGKVRLSLRGTKGVENFTDRPNYVGDNLADGENKGITYKLATSPGNYELTVHVTASAASGGEPISLCVDAICHELSVGDQRHEFLVVQPKSVYLKSDLDIAYAVLNSLEWKREE